MAQILITGVAGFIGSHLLAHALDEGHSVVGVDNFLTGKMENIEAVVAKQPIYEERFRLLRDDIRDPDAMRHAASDCQIIFHQAAVGSVPWSIDDPRLTHDTNLTGFLNILDAARANNIRRVVYASSSAVFGDAPAARAIEGAEGSSLTPYAASKFSQEIYAQAYAQCYGMELIGLRYFNVFGERQDPKGAYAAVIPRWIHAMKRGEPCTIYGDGSSTRDYCHVSNIVLANALAARADLKNEPSTGRAIALNIGCGIETTLTELHAMIQHLLETYTGIKAAPPTFTPPRPGDIQHSCADITRAQQILSYNPHTNVYDGLKTLLWGNQFPHTPCDTPYRSGA
ncbi:MAG: NAD-dependent epimerase/dehydratase family protein [Proteobacteria bacterium]|nr:NAD-dependent epimerase/dehydratase family protein [Pseudomonadota bacterium]